MFAVYVLGSATLSAMAVTNAYMGKQQFYPTVIYLVESKTNMVVMANMALALLILLGRVVKSMFFGTLRPAEIERLQDRSRIAVIETCLMMTMFREEFSFRFAALFAVLLFVKIFHWLTVDRINFIEQQPNAGRMAHIRIVVMMGLLLAVDTIFISQHVATTMQKGPSMLLLFVFEYTIQIIRIVKAFGKYSFFMIDQALDNRWEQKGTYSFYMELLGDFLQLFVHIVFFLLIHSYYGLPIYIIKDLIDIFNSFSTKCREFIRYRQLTSNMNERFANPTEADITEGEGGDPTCIICREEMTMDQLRRNQLKKLPCGHAFHVHCLRSWLERQKSCPTCRTDIPVNPQQVAAATAAAAAAAAAGQAARAAQGHAHGAQPAAPAAGAPAPAPAPTPTPAPAPAPAAAAAPAPTPAAVVRQPAPAPAAPEPAAPAPAAAPPAVAPSTAPSVLQSPSGGLPEGVPPGSPALPPQAMMPPWMQGMPQQMPGGGAQPLPIGMAMPPGIPPMPAGLSPPGLSPHAGMPAMPAMMPGMMPQGQPGISPMMQPPGMMPYPQGWPQVSPQMMGQMPSPFDPHGWPNASPPMPQMPQVMPQMPPQMPPAFGANPYGGMMAQQQQPEAQAPPAAPTPDPALAAMQAQIAALQAQLLAANTPETATVRHAFP